jgi:hypothetical protein
MSNAEEVLKLQREFEGQLHTDPIFRARTTLVRNVLEELGRMGRLEPGRDGGYAGYIVVAALEKALPPQPQSEAWARGVADGQRSMMGHTITDPYKETP